MKSSKQKNLLKHGFLTLVFAIASFFGHMWLETRFEEKVQYFLETKSNEIKSNLAANLKVRMNVMNRLALRVSDTNKKSESFWINDTSQIYKDFDGIQAIEWVDKELVARWVYPKVGNRDILNKKHRLGKWDLMPLEKSIKLKNSFLSTSHK